MRKIIGRSSSDSDFEWGYDGNVIWVKDLDNGGISITNNIDQVLRYINQHLPVTEYLFMYRDSTGTWDRVVVKDTKYLIGHFASLNEREYEKAIAKLRMQAAIE